MSVTTDSLSSASTQTADSPKPAATPDAPAQFGWSAFEVWRSRVWRRPEIANFAQTPVGLPETGST